MTKRSIVLLLAGLSLASLGFAQTLSPGMKAPELKAAAWLKGEPISKFEKGKIYVIDFWATWCGFCIEGMPHLTKLSKEYADKVSFIAMDVWEQPGDIAEKVKKKVDELGDKMDVNVGRDDKDGFMAKNWLAPAKIGGIPTTFVIDGEGTIAWVGHPSELKPVLDKLIAGKFDLEASKKRFLDSAANEERMQKSVNDFKALAASYEKNPTEETLLKLQKIGDTQIDIPGLAFKAMSLGLGGNHYPIAEKHIRERIAKGDRGTVQMFMGEKFEVKPANKAAYVKLRKDLLQTCLKWLDEKKDDFFLPLSLAQVSVELKDFKQAQTLADLAKKRFEASSGKYEGMEQYVKETLEKINKGIEEGKKSSGSE